MFDPPKSTVDRCFVVATLLEAACIALFVVGIMGVAFTSERHAPHSYFVELRK